MMHRLLATAFAATALLSSGPSEASEPEGDPLSQGEYVDGEGFAWSLLTYYDASGLLKACENEVFKTPCDEVRDVLPRYRMLKSPRITKRAITSGLLVAYPRDRLSKFFVVVPKESCATPDGVIHIGNWNKGVDTMGDWKLDHHRIRPFPEVKSIVEYVGVLMCTFAQQRGWKPTDEDYEPPMGDGISYARSVVHGPQSGIY